MLRRTECHREEAAVVFTPQFTLKSTWVKSCKHLTREVSGTAGIYVAHLWRNYLCIA